MNQYTGRVQSILEQNPGAQIGVDLTPGRNGNMDIPSNALAAKDREIARLREALTECSDDLECEIEARYSGTKDHPAMTPKYERDMEPVIKARAALAQDGRE